MMRIVLAMLLCALLASAAHAQEDDVIGGGALVASPYEQAVRIHYYELLSRSPAKSFLWELALPGAGHVYAGFRLQAVISATLAVTGASLWIAGAVRDHDALWWTGAGTFAVGRLYGLISAPVSAALLNAAYRRQLGIRRAF